jgi:hypothetical protein
VTWWPFVLLGLAAYRTWRLLAEDTILDRPRAWVVRSEWVSEFLSCCWCAGFWVAVAWWAAWLAWPHETIWAAVPFALSAALGLVASHVGSDD